VTTARALEAIERNAKLLSELIEDLLDVSRLIRGKLSLQVCPVNLIPIIQAAIETVQLAAGAKRIQLESVLNPSLGLVSGDPNRLQQIVWNLLSNAIKFTPEGGKVEIRLECSNSHTQIRVSDTGKGISADFLPYVFERFRQADSTSTRSHGGLGLGLAIVRHLAELHGGTVHVDSPGEGLGAIFTVQLPLIITTRENGLLAPGHEVETEPEAPPTSDAIISAVLDGLQVLVVDDEPDSRELLTLMFEQDGAEMIEAASASEALEALERLKPDILISDIKLPDEDGYSLIHKVRNLNAEQGGQIPAIALTGYAGEENRDRALSAGFNRHLSKPFGLDELAEVVATLAGREH